MKVVIAPDKWRGSASAAEVATTVAAAAEMGGWAAHQVPMADGGEGTLEALGGANRTTMVTGPLGDIVAADWRCSGGQAVVEMARASGMALVGRPDENDAPAASTYGTGELITAALDAGCRRVIVGMGGSATTDGGLGALRALEPLARLRGVKMVVACDVNTRFVDAATVFGPQKGASPAQVELLRRRLERLAQVYEQTYGVDVRSLSGGGAAGGLAGGLGAVGATLVPGFDLVAEEVGLCERLEGVDLVITGEGRLDEQSFDGKVVGSVAKLAWSAGLPVVAIVGEVEDGFTPPGGVTVVSLSERFGPERSLSETLACLHEVTAELLPRFVH